MVSRSFCDRCGLEITGTNYELIRKDMSHLAREVCMNCYKRWEKYWKQYWGE